MTRASRSYRSTAVKEPKEAKADRLKRLENYRVAKQQAKKVRRPTIGSALVVMTLTTSFSKRLSSLTKSLLIFIQFVIPGILALLIGLFFLFGTMYGFRGGAKVQRRNRTPQDMIYEAAANGPDLETTKLQVKNDFMKVLENSPVEEIAVE
ncbi:hypothetical protein BGZ67_001078 [Mortierella alpina]|nr:hypothetical protein BGZ67_001078 [Mortierella alpina]